MVANKDVLKTASMRPKPRNRAELAADVQANGHAHMAPSAAVFHDDGSITPAVLPQMVAQAPELDSPLFTNDEVISAADVQTGPARIKARDIIGVPWVCVGVDMRDPGEKSLNDKPYFVLTLFFRGTGEQPFTVTAAGAYMDALLTRLAGKVDYAHAVKGCFDYVPNYTPRGTSDVTFHPLYIAKWRSARGETDAVFTPDGDGFPF